MLGEVRSDVKTLTNQVIGIIGPKVDLLTNAITTIGLSSSARILSRPEAVAELSGQGLSTDGLRSKSWDEFAQPGAPVMDLVITVCDAAGGEVCPIWPGGPVRAHWGIPDPADDHGSPEKNRAAFELAYCRLSARAAALIALALDRLSPAELRARLAEIGRLEGATEQALSASD